MDAGLQYALGRGYKTPSYVCIVHSLAARGDGKALWVMACHAAATAALTLPLLRLVPLVPATITALLLLLDLPWAARSMGAGMSH